VLGTTTSELLGGTTSVGVEELEDSTVEELLGGV
jgi:hypothetical protein